MSAHYVITGEPVSGKNHMQIRYNRRTKSRYVTKSDAASAWQISAVEQLLEQRGRRKTLRSEVSAELHVYQKNSRRDLDNVVSAVFDALTKAGLIEDDRQIGFLIATGTTVEDAPRVEITLTPADA